MRKPPFKPLRQCTDAGKRDFRRDKSRTRPRLEPLEGRIVMSTFVVNTTSDSVAVNLHAGKDATGHISLRSAIMAANARGGSNTILLRKGTYTLSIAGANEDASATGDLDITSNLTIKGAGAPKTFIDANSLDRVIEILHGTVAISGVAIEGGMATIGGGILNMGGRVTLSSVAVAGNSAVGSSGASSAPGASGGQIGGPGVAGGNASAGLGGAIFNGSGSLAIVNSAIFENQAIGGDGGQGSEGGTGQGASQAGANGQNAVGGPGGAGGAGGAALGGGIYNATGASLVLSGTTIAFNLATGGSGGPGGAGGEGDGGAGGAVNGVAATVGGLGSGGTGGAGATGGAAQGGGLFNAGTVILQRSMNTFSHNFATGGDGGLGGKGGNANGGMGGSGIGATPGRGGAGGNALAGVVGSGGFGADGEGGGIYNATGGSLTSTVALLVSSNDANGGIGGDSGTFGDSTGGNGGTADTNGAGGPGGSARGGDGARAGTGGAGSGGGVFNASGATFVLRPPNNRTTIPTSTFSGNVAGGRVSGNPERRRSARVDPAGEAAPVEWAARAAMVPAVAA
jgi:hypothetical protein